MIDILSDREAAGASAESPLLALPGDRTGSSTVVRRYGRRDFLLRRLLALADVAAISVALLLAAFAEHRTDMQGYLLWGALTLPGWLLIFKMYGLYDKDAKRISHTTVDDVPGVFHSLLIGLLLMWAYYKWAPPEQLVAKEVAWFATSAGICVLALRSAVRRLSRHVIGAERVLFVGDPETTNLVSKMRAHPEYGLEPVGIMSPGVGVGRPHPVLTVIEHSEGQRVEDLLRRLQVDRLVLSHTDLPDEEMLGLLRECRELNIKVSVLPQLFDVMGSSVEIDDVEGVTVLGINPTLLPRSSRFIKRALDLAVSTAALVVSAPFLIMIALAIKIDSRGPIFFCQERVGKGGARLKLLKFRTMVPYAERVCEELRSQSSDPGWLKLENDPRITRVGRLLRLSSLDELPQLWNVLKGEMSLVGPRPLIDAEDRQISGWGRRRLDLTPGITGLWQVLGRTDIPFAEMVKLDYLYVTNWSLWSDVRLILRTLPAVLTRRGAN